MLTWQVNRVLPAQWHHLILVYQRLVILRNKCTLSVRLGEAVDKDQHVTINCDSKILLIACPNVYGIEITGVNLYSEGQRGTRFTWWIRRNRRGCSWWGPRGTSHRPPRRWSDPPSSLGVRGGGPRGSHPGVNWFFVEWQAKIIKYCYRIHQTRFFEDL